LTARDPATDTAAAPGPGTVSVWLALPESGNTFDEARLDAAERERFAARRHPQRRLEFAVSRGLLGHVQPPPDAATSLAHSDGHAALACAPGQFGIGVDLERHRPRDVLSIARFAFADSESAALAALPPAQHVERFYALWVIKEALAKALRLDLLDALTACVVVETAGGWRIRLPAQLRARVIVYRPEDNLSLAVALVGTEVAALPIVTRTWPPGRDAAWDVVATLDSLP